MADHLQIPSHIDLPSKRPLRRFDPDPPPFDFGQHATTLRGVLEGLESLVPGIFTDRSQDDEESHDEDLDASELGDVVLTFTGATAFESNAFKAVGLIPLAVNDERRYYALTDANARKAFREYVDEYLDGPDDFSAGSDNLRAALRNIEGVELYNRQDRIIDEGIAPSGDEVTDVDIVLWPTSIATQGAMREGERRVAAVVTIIDALAVDDSRVGSLSSSATDPDLLLIHARLNEAAFDAVAEHPYVERIRGALSVTVSQSDLAQGAPPSDTILPEGAPIGIIDDLVVDSNPWLEGVIEEQRSFPQDFAFGTATAHGTQVASIAAWGDVRQLLDPDYEGQPHPLFVARVAQMNTSFETQVVGNPADQLRDALDWLASREVKVVVLALGESHADDGAIPSDLSAIVDQKIAEHDLVVVTSAGNIRDIDGEWKDDYPRYLSDAASKVAAPGTAASSVTVTSVAHTPVFDRTRWPNGIAIAQAGQTSPFSRTGPTRGPSASGRQKPEFAAHGGSWALDEATGNLIVDDAELSATTLIPPVNGRLFAAATGTSMAAPRVAHEIARIKTRYQDASGNLLRALIALAGDARPKGSYKPGEAVGGIYGVPNADRVLESGGNQVIFTYEGTMPTNRHAVIRLPIPKEFAYGASERELRIALAFDPPVKRSRRDYVAGRMRFDFLHRENLSDIKRAYANQPTRAEREAAGLALVELPDGRKLEPPKTRLFTDTLICRSYFSRSGGWDVDDEHYFVVVSHDHSPWTQSQKNQYKNQRFALAVQLVDHGRIDLDLYAHAKAELAAQLRGQARA